jgi:hypothetical protein
VEYALLSYFFSLQIRNRIIRKALWFSTIPFALFCLFDFIRSSGPELPFGPLAVEYVMLLIFIIYFFFEVMDNTKSEPIYQKPVFWISSAFILNFSGNFFLFLYSKNSYSDNEVFQQHYTIIYGTITILKNILLCISAYQSEEIPNTPNHSIDVNLDSFYPHIKKQ